MLQLAASTKVFASVCMMAAFNIQCEQTMFPQQWQASASSLVAGDLAPFIALLAGTLNPLACGRLRAC
jgi:hypothetical protein